MILFLIIPFAPALLNETSMTSSYFTASFAYASAISFLSFPYELDKIDTAA